MGSKSRGFWGEPRYRWFVLGWVGASVASFAGMVAPHPAALAISVTIGSLLGFVAAREVRAEQEG